MSAAYPCPARFTRGGRQCERELGHPGQHWAERKTIRWGGRYTPAELSGKPGAMRDGERERRARVRRPRGQRCSVCCQPREAAELERGRCIDRAACELAQPALFA